MVLSFPEGIQARAQPATSPDPARALRPHLQARLNWLRHARPTAQTTVSPQDALLRVLDRPEIPLNTNASENDIRAFVTKRKISGGTVSLKGRDARDIMLGLAKTCMKLKLSFNESLGSRLGMPRYRNLAPRRSHPTRAILTLSKRARKFAPITHSFY